MKESEQHEDMDENLGRCPQARYILYDSFKNCGFAVLLLPEYRLDFAEESGMYQSARSSELPFMLSLLVRPKRHTQAYRTQPTKTWGL